MQQEFIVGFPRRARAAVALAALLLGLGAQADASLDRIVAAVEKQHQARVRRVEETTVKGRKVYALRLQKDGKVWEIKVDAETGKEL
jgi:uncharacterized membrane protein YkoI